MPRAPLRRRQQNRNAPVPRTFTFKKISNSSPAKAELTKKLANKPVGTRPTDSDDSDRLVVRGNGRRGRYEPKQEIYASGAVGKGDKPGNHPTRAQRRKSLTDTTQEILANGQRADARKDRESNSGKTESQSKVESPHVNGVVKKSTAAKRDTAQLSRVGSSAVKDPGSALRPVQPTPSRENSILGILKPRRRQPSILQNLDQDSSIFDIEDEEEFLPDNESTPLNQPKPRHSLATPARPSSLPSSSSRKRKLGVSEIFDPIESRNVDKPVSSPISNGQRPQPSPEPSLPAIPVSALRESGRKQRESLRDEDDVMALPQSSSSPAPSPAKKRTPASTATLRKAAKPAPAMTTKELLEATMPTKRRRTARTRTQNRNDFDIQADSDIDDAQEEDYSNFLPSKKGRKPRRKELVSKPSTARIKAPAKSKANSQAAGKKPKSSTSHFTTISTSAPILAPSVTSNRETKSPSQQLSTTNTSFNIDIAAEKVAQKRYGGSRRAKGGTTANAGDKENQSLQVSRDDLPDHEEDSASGSGTGSVGKTVPVSKGKWKDIDDWDMDFEEVEVMTGSSSPTRR